MWLTETTKKKGKIMRTNFQKTHKPVKRFEIKCNGNVVDGFCEECGRFLDLQVPHNPNETGSLGYIEQYSNGSFYNTAEETSY
jgi:hypothetical protein